MNDIFNNTILCGNCNSKMEKGQIQKNGFILRAMECKKCGERIIHPRDEQEYNDYMNLKKKEFNVKMRMVGNSYAVSIPREIVDFMREQEKMMNDMVRLCFNDSHSLSLNFNTGREDMENENSNPNQMRRVIQAKEYRVVRDNKPVIHVKQVYDSANPKNNKIQVFKNNNLNEENKNDRKK